jgi:hypothetical protein
MGAKILNISISLQMANIERKKFQLEQDEGTIIGEENLKVFISEYYKGLFGAPPQNHFTLLEDRIDDIPQLSCEEKNVLSADFTEIEVKEAVMQMKKNKAPGPDGFPAEFYQVFWDTIKEDMMAMFYQLQAGDLPLFRLNFGIITLLPKKEDASRIEQYRPIFLLNVSFKIFTKVGANRITDGPKNHQTYPNCFHPWQKYFGRSGSIA